MRPKETGLAHKLEARLDTFHKQKHPLPGIIPITRRKSFIEQLIESIRRIRYVSVIGKRGLSDLRADPLSEYFDPLRAAMLFQRQGDTEEAFWMVFLFVHFGKNQRTGWRLVRDIYGSLGNVARWDWARINSDPKGFRRWLAKHQGILQGGDGIRRYFGNHRKYETLKDSSARGTGKVVESYVRWVCAHGSHEKLIQEAQSQVGGDPRETFNYLYRSMTDVISFGRTARFDYLTMVGKLGLASIEPGSTYMKGATGPLKGAQLLFGGSAKAATVLDAWLVELEANLGLDFGMQVLEDALCNWQKSPGKFKPFRG